MPLPDALKDMAQPQAVQSNVHDFTCRNAWLLPVLAPLLPHMLARLSAKWAARVSQPASGRPSEDGTAANDDVVEERLVRELTREHLQLLLNMADKPSPEPGQGATPAGDLAFRAI